MKEEDRDLFIPIVVTLIAVIIWATFMLLYVLAWSSNYDWLQSLAVVLISLVMVGGYVGLLWMYWIFKRAKPKPVATAASIATV